MECAIINALKRGVVGFFGLVMVMVVLMPMTGHAAAEGSLQPEMGNEAQNNGGGGCPLQILTVGVTRVMGTFIGDLTGLSKRSAGVQEVGAQEACVQEGVQAPAVAEGKEDGDLPPPYELVQQDWLPSQAEEPLSYHESEARIREEAEREERELREAEQNAKERLRKVEERRAAEALQDDRPEERRPLHAADAVPNAESVKLQDPRGGWRVDRSGNGRSGASIRRRVSVKIACLTCTFHNEPGAVKCEMCDTVLPKSHAVVR